MDKPYKVVVHGLRGEKNIIDLCNTEEQMKNMTVLQLKQRIAEVLSSGTNPESAGKDYRLIFTDKYLYDDSALLSEYGVQHMSVIKMEKILRGGGRYDPGKGDGGMGDKDKNRSMERLSGF